MILQNSPEPGGFAIEARFLQCIDCVPHQPLKSLNISFPFRNRGIMTSPLTDERPGRAVSSGVE
jgi:hypothetical protein